jgi:DNA-directed RNA polymerase specialized sigma24 family protein
MCRPDLHEALAPQRAHFERIAYGRLKAAITWEDAEDIVSDALLRADRTAENDPPAPGNEEAWFGRIVIRTGIDFVRARDGRSRDGSSRRPTVVSLTALSDVGHEPSDHGFDFGTRISSLPDESMGDASERRHSAEVVDRALAQLDPGEVELIKLRHLVGPDCSRARIAEMAGLTVAEFRWRYTKAWSRFIRAVESDAPTPRCEYVRQMIGDVDAGVVTASAAQEIDAHILDCPSCRVFARESYRTLELIPFIPTAGLAERWCARVGWWWERSGGEAVAGAGAGAAGVGLAGLFGGSGLAGALKVAAVVCSATAVTAGICSGVAVFVHELSEPAPATAVAKRTHRAKATPTPTPVLATATPRPRPTATARPKTARSKVDTSGEKQIPASAPAGSSEFNPSASGASKPPAPAPENGGGEFTP